MPTSVVERQTGPAARASEAEGASLWRVGYVTTASSAPQYEDVRAASAQAAMNAVAARGDIPFDAEELAAASPSGLGRLRRVVLRRREGRADVTEFALELALLLEAGLTLPEALSTLEQACSHAGLRGALQRAEQAVRAGKPLSYGLGLSGDMFPATLIASVQAAQTSGRLPEVLRRYVGYAEALSKLKQSVINAAIYPVLVTVFGLAVLAFLLVFVLPRFSVAYESMALTQSASTRFLLGLATVVKAHWQIMAIGLIGVVWWVSRWVAQPANRQRVLQWSFAVPIVRSVPMAYTLSGFYRTLELMLRGGYTVIEALREARPVVQGTPLGGALEIALPQIERGKTLTEAFSESELLSGITRRLIAAGERTGRLADVVGQTALHHERQLERAVTRASRVVEPVLLMGVASVIALVVFLMYSPIFDLASSISL